MMVYLRVEIIFSVRNNNNDGFKEVRSCVIYAVGFKK
jgi:hypothetical protein